MITAPARTSAEPSDPTSRGWRVLARGARIQFSWCRSKRGAFQKSRSSAAVKPARLCGR